MISSHFTIDVLWFTSNCISRLIELDAAQCTLDEPNLSAEAAKSRLHLVSTFSTWIDAHCFASVEGLLTVPQLYIMHSSLASKLRSGKVEHLGWLPTTHFTADTMSMMHAPCCIPYSSTMCTLLHHTQNTWLWHLYVRVGFLHWRFMVSCTVNYCYLLLQYSATLIIQTRWDQGKTFR